MKKQLYMALILSAALGLSQKTEAQINYNLGVGYYAESTKSPGLVIQLERERFHSDL